MNSPFIKIGFSLLAVMGCLSIFTACDEDTKDEADRPAIYKQIEELAKLIDGKTTCAEIRGAVNNYQTTAAKPIEPDPISTTALGKACADYVTSLQTVGSNASRLAAEKTNSGFYMATYIYLKKWNDAVETCAATPSDTQTETLAAFKALFETAGCSTILEDAKKAVGTQLIVH